MMRDDRAALVKCVQTLRETCEEMLEILMPDEDRSTACRHPAEKVIDDSTMGEELYRCGVCGAESNSLPIPVQE